MPVTVRSNSANAKHDSLESRQRKWANPANYFHRRITTPYWENSSSRFVGVIFQAYQNVFNKSTYRNQVGYYLYRKFTFEVTTLLRLIAWLGGIFFPNTGRYLYPAMFLRFVISQVKSRRTVHEKVLVNHTRLDRNIVFTHQKYRSLYASRPSYFGVYVYIVAYMIYTSFVYDLRLTKRKQKNCTILATTFSSAY